MPKHKHDNSGTRPSVFERLGGKSMTYCTSWLKSGSCSYGKNCKYVNSHIKLSGVISDKRSKQDLGGHHSKSKMKSHSSGKGTKDRSPDLDTWDQSDLEYADEKVLQKRLELLKRELLNSSGGDSKSEHHGTRTKHHSRAKHKVVIEKKKRKHSSSSSSSSSSASSTSSSSSSSSSSTSNDAPVRHKHNVNRRSASSSPSTKKPPRSFQKHNKERHISPPVKKIVNRNTKSHSFKGNYKETLPVKSARHKTPPKRKGSPVKQTRNVPAAQKSKRNYSPPNKRDRKSSSPVRRPVVEKKGHSPKRARTPPHRSDMKHVRKKSPPVRDNRNQRNNIQQRKSPPFKRNLDRNDDRSAKFSGNKNIVKSRFDKNRQDDKRSNSGYDKREEERFRDKRRTDLESKDRRKSLDKQKDVKKREVDRRDKDRPDRDRMTDVRRHKENDKFVKSPRIDHQSKHNSTRDDRRPSLQIRTLKVARTPAQTRILDRILERKSYLGERNNDKDKVRDKEGLRDRGLDRVHSEHNRSGSREHGEFESRSKDDLRFPPDERLSPSVRGGGHTYPENRRNWGDRNYGEGEGDWDRKFVETPGKWDRSNRRNDWERKKDDWGPGEWNDGLDLPARILPRASRPPHNISVESTRPINKRTARSGEDLEEVLSDISDDADEILNRDEEELGSDAEGSDIDDEPDFKISAHICGPMQDPLTQRLLADDFDFDFEDASDEDGDNAKTTICDALGVDWASLVEETKPRVNNDTGEEGSVKRRWEPGQIFSRLGLSETYAGKDMVDNLKQKYQLNQSEAGVEDKDPTSSRILHSIPGVHSALGEKIKARRLLFDPSRRALSARHDLNIRRQICAFPVTLLHQAHQQTPAVAS